MSKYENIFNEIVKQTGEYCIKHNIKSLVLGLSGGLDSTVCAVIGKEVFNRYGIELIGVSLPSKTNHSDENDIAKMCGDAFCNRFYCVNIDTLYGASKYMCDNYIGESTNISQGNLKARIRMIMLYNTASINKGIVIDTDNLSEHYLGFWTIHGDVGDFKPIGKLWKTEVYELAEYIKTNYNTIISSQSESFSHCDSAIAKLALEHAIKITPTDGNGVNNLGDMGQIAPGYTYTEVDKVLQGIVYNPNFTTTLEDIADEYFNGDIDTVNKIATRYLNSQFKRNTNYVGVIL